MKKAYANLNISCNQKEQKVTHVPANDITSSLAVGQVRLTAVGGENRSPAQ